MKAKEPVRLRAKKLADGNESLYLDIYVDGKRKYEFLKLYIVPEVNKQSKEQNKATLNIANAVKAQRILDVQSGKFGFETSQRVLLMELFKEVADAKLLPNWASVYNTLLNYCDPTKTFIEDITPQWLLDFEKWLRDGGRKQTTVKIYMSKLGHVLREAVKRDIIDKNPYSKITISAGRHSPRAYLTIEELRTLFATPAPNMRHADVVCRMFRFSALTGLRWSDVYKLRWGEVSDNNGMTRITFSQKKTGNTEYMDITDQAYELMGERKGGDEKVFNTPDDIYINKHKIIGKWVKESGIDKHISFHCARHSFATMMLTLGTDLYTVSKLLGHTNISTTQIYAKIVDKQKQDAVKKIPKIT